MTKKNDKKWMQIGNFLLGEEKNSLGRVLCVKAVSGQWSIRWGEETYVFAVLTRLMCDKNCYSYIEALLSLFFTATNYTHDFAALAETHKTPFIDGFCKLMNEQTELELGFRKEASPEEDKEALDDIVEMHEVMEELGKLDAENDKAEEDGVH